jgi:hypothetical protein
MAQDLGGLLDPEKEALKNMRQRAKEKVSSGKKHDVLNPWFAKTPNWIAA